MTKKQQSYPKIVVQDGNGESLITQAMKTFKFEVPGYIKAKRTLKSKFMREIYNKKKSKKDNNEDDTII